MTPKTTPRPAVAVVICCFSDDRRSELDAAIRSATAQLGTDDHLVVVVDHNEPLRQWLTGRVPANTVLVANTDEPGLSGARNTGVAATDADVVVFLDDDAALRPGAIDAARAAFDDDTVVAVGGAVHARWADGAPPAWFPEEFGWVVGCDYRGLPADGAEIRNPIGAAMAVRRDALVKIGGFSRRLGRVGSVPAGCEETLMGIELRRLRPDSRIVRVTDFAVDHYVPRTRASLRYFVDRCRHEGRSKAVLSSMVGAGAGLSAERAFVLRTLSTGIARDLRRAVTGGGIGALTRVLTILLGLLVTASATALTAVRGTALTAVRGTALTAVRGTARPESASTGPDDPAGEPPVTTDELVSIVIATVGRPSLADTARAVLAQTHPNIELLVVDNRPHRSSVSDIIADVGDPRLRVVEEPAPGVSAARNRGAAAARGRIIAFTDDDALPDPDWVARIVESFAADEAGVVGVVTGRVLGTESATREQAWFEEAKIFDKGAEPTVWSLGSPRTPASLGRHGERGPFFPFTAGECGSGNNMAFRRSALARTGGFDERLGTGTPTRGGEDLDAFRSALLADWAIAYNPLAIVRHYHRDNLDDLRVQSYGYGTGMAASLTKLFLSGPSGAWSIVRRLPRGVYMLLAPNSTKNADLPSDWPFELRLREAWGYLTGPLLYVRSRPARSGRLDLS